MASPPIFKISPEIPCGPMDFFLMIADNNFLIMLILILKGLVISVDLICGSVSSQQKQMHNKS
jgi:hypothetical protein